MSTVSPCGHCGAPLEAGAGYPVVCRFCDTSNAAPPPRVEVPVPVQIVHNVVHVEAGAAAETRELRCPHCRKRLVTVRVGEVELSGCGRCGGIWVDNDSARRLLAAPQRVVVELADRASANAASHTKPRSATPACPRCPATLEKNVVHQVQVDLCPDHGTWFDTYELQIVVRRLLGEGGPPPPAPDGTVPCAECRQPTDQRRANIGMNGPTCDACWRAHQLSLVAKADAEHTRSAAAAGAAILLGAVLGGLASGSRR